jgi:hypothetical protein
MPWRWAKGPLRQIAEHVCAEVTHRQFVFTIPKRLGLFSVDQSVRLGAGGREGIQRLIQYFLRCPFSQARMIEVTDARKVLYKTGDPPSPFQLRRGRQFGWGDFPKPPATTCWRVPSATSRFSIRWTSSPKSPSTRLRSAELRRGRHPGVGRTPDPVLRLILE